MQTPAGGGPGAADGGPEGPAGEPDPAAGEPDEAHDEDAPAPLATLPEPVRNRVILWSAQALGGLPQAQIPSALLRVARFTPAKRARMGAAALAAAVQADAAFRAVVAQFVAGEGQDPAAGDTDPVGAAARAYLLRLPEELPLMDAARAWMKGSGARAEAEALRGQVQRLTTRLESITAELEQLRRATPAPDDTAFEEVDKLRRRLREQGARLRTAEQAASGVRQEQQADIDRLTGALASAGADARRWQERALAEADRADRAQETVARQRDAAGRARTTADRRLELLLATIEGASAGLRREWDLQGGGTDPADLVAEKLPGPTELPEVTHDPARLQSWLMLPHAHMIIDGYNVTKTGFPELTLAQQRERLVRAVAALAARTSSDVTVVFDGATVAVPQPSGRGVRVLFSPAGVIADDVISDLAAAEPHGRVVVVISSDREVVRRVRRSGARAAGSKVLLGLLG